MRSVQFACVLCAMGALFMVTWLLSSSHVTEGLKVWLHIKHLHAPYSSVPQSKPILCMRFDIMAPNV